MNTNKLATIGGTTVQKRLAKVFVACIKHRNEIYRLQDIDNPRATSLAKKHFALIRQCSIEANNLISCLTPEQFTKVTTNKSFSLKALYEE